MRSMVAASWLLAVASVVLLAGPVGARSPSPVAGTGPVVVTMQVIDETFRVALTGPDDIANAWALLRGDEVPGILNGRVVRADPGVNAPWSWHLDPNDFEWADVTTEVCDGLPSDVEAGLITSDRYCPWLVDVLSVELAPPISPPVGVGTMDICLTITGPTVMLTAESLTRGIIDGTFTIDALSSGCAVPVPAP